MQFTVTLPTTLAMFGLHHPLDFCTSRRLRLLHSGHDNQRG